MKSYICLLITAVVVIADQVSKYLVRNFISPFDTINVLPFLNIVSVRNRGAAFGMFRSFGNIPFIVISLAAIIFVLYLLLQKTAALKPNYINIYKIALALILGGAIGNLIDRIFIGSVVDFIDVFAGGYHWYTFNIADSALTIGMILMLFTIRHTTDVKGKKE